MSTETGKTYGTGAQLLIPVVALLMLAGVGCSEKETSTTQEAAPAMESAAPEAAPPAEVTEPAPEPAAEPTEPQAAAEAAAESQTAAVDGQKIYQASCQACHAAGVAGAPKLSDKAAWVPRIAKGNDALMSSVKNGLNVMPPKGGCMSCSDDELRAAIEYMVAEGS
jgi:cytochrome c5